MKINATHHVFAGISQLELSEHNVSPISDEFVGLNRTKKINALKERINIRDSLF